MHGKMFLGGAPPTFIEYARVAIEKDLQFGDQSMLDLIIGLVGRKPKIDLRSAYLLY